MYWKRQAESDGASWPRSSASSVPLRKLCLLFTNVQFAESLGSGGTHNLLLAELREEPVEPPKQNGEVVDATLEVKPSNGPESALQNEDGDTEMKNGAEEASATADGAAADGQEDTQMNGVS